MRRLAISSVGVFVACLAVCAARRRAQARRVPAGDAAYRSTSIASSVEIDLTAGASVAASVFGWIDTDGDGQLSGAEARGVRPAGDRLGHAHG